MGRLTTAKLVSALWLLHSIGAIVTVEGYMVGNNPYHRAEILDSLGGEGKYKLEWLIDLEGKRVTFNVTVETTGYVGFGLSSYGKMSGADIVIGGVNPDGTSYFSDRHAIGHHTPEIDPSQDWVLHSAKETRTHTFLSFSRAFDTCDPQDYPITEDKISLIWAFGERDTIQYHHRNRGEFPVHLINPDYTPLMTRDPRSNRVIVDQGERVKGQSDIRVWTIERRLELPAEDTTYWCTMHKGPKLARRHHTIGFEVSFPNAEGRQHTHHIILHKCHPPAGRNGRMMFEQWVGHRGQRCLSLKAPTGPMPTEYCTDYAMGWAVGGRIFFHPNDVGMAIGDSPEEYYLLQIHYSNPNTLTGVIARTSIDIFYTSQLRPIESGIMTIRHETPGLPPSLIVPPSSIDHKLHGHCGPACTRRFFPEEGITIYGILLHSHNSGRRMRFQHFRNGRELPWIASDDTYSFNYQQFRVLNRPVKVLPGDQVVMTCTYDNTWTNGTVVGGFSTKQEMCATWVMYHTKLPDYMQCSSEIDSPQYRQRFLGVTNVTWQNSRLEFVVDPPHPLAGLTISQVSDNHVNWNLERREALQRLHLYHPHVNYCPTELYARASSDTDNAHGRLSDGTYENSEDTDVRMASYPVEAIPHRPRQSCSFKRG